MGPSYYNIIFPSITLYLNSLKRFVDLAEFCLQTEPSVQGPSVQGPSVQGPSVQEPNKSEPI